MHVPLPSSGLIRSLRSRTERPYHVPPAERRPGEFHRTHSDTGALTAPVVGKFQNGVGVFEANDDYKGQAIRVRYTWSHITANNARWEQAFSPDGGTTWEVNWVMQFTRKPS